MNQVMPKTHGPVAVSKLWANVPKDNSDLMEGVAISFPRLVLGAREWIVRWKGEDRAVKIPNTDYPAPFVDVVILNAQKEMSRAFYRDAYQQGAKGKKPDCWSTNGIKPDDSIPNPVNPICATCPNDAWGSGGSPAAPKAKACLQRRRTVVVPYPDIANEAEGGPMLLSVPPGSLQNQVRYGKELQEMDMADGSKGMFYAACVTRLSFESGVKFPKVQFEFVKALTDEESQLVINMRTNAAVENILQSKMDDEELETAVGDAAPATTSQVNIPKAPPVGAGPKPTAPAKPAPAAQAQPAKPAVGGHPVTNIADAVAKPSAPPPSQRPVAMAPAIVEPEDNEEEAKADLGETTALFDKLMSME